MSTTQDRRWTAWHLHVSTLGAPATDRVVRHVIAAAADAVGQWEDGSEWFFLRYWQNGPHVRFRAAVVDPDRESQLDALLRSKLAEILADDDAALTPEEYRRQAGPLAAAGEAGRALDTGELLPAGVYRRAYEPELERYGGSALMARSESLFHQSSELALAFLRLQPPEAARSGLGLRATQAALETLVTENDRVRFCRSSASGWQAWAERGGSGKVPAPPPPAGLEGRPPTPVRRWADQLGRAMTLWRSATTDAQAERILHAHIHMLHNRLGLSVAQECNHYLVLATAVAA